ncbi:uncharacterized protein LOC124808903 isoform X2 [Hydra vulgaris]|uniref:Uncharacterized protein LOC124808903 isoform X2 n=1 Tax=Hydra vulgaris TaxID=6087 RepID=A0ABM4BIB6_HYDVU
MSFWAHQTTKQSVSSHASSSSLEFQHFSDQFNEPIDVVDTTSDASRHDILSTVQIETKKAKTHVQDKIKAEIIVLNQEIVAMKSRKRSGLWTDAKEETIKKKKANVQELTSNLNSLIGNMKSKQRSRAEKKTVMNQVFANHPEVKKALKVRDGIGHPTIEVEQSEILRVIIQLAEHGSAAHEKRQSEVYRSLKSLDELGAELEKRGYNLSRSVLYTRLLPKRSDSLEGKRHVHTVPVKLMRAPFKSRGWSILYSNYKECGRSLLFFGPQGCVLYKSRP